MKKQTIEISKEALLRKLNIVGEVNLIQYKDNKLIITGEIILDKRKVTNLFDTGDEA